MIGLRDMIDTIKLKNIILKKIKKNIILPEHKLEFRRNFWSKLKF
jgi:hypothetical protein